MRFTYASALLGATLASVASADDWNTWPHFVDSVQADITNVGDFENPSAPARVWNGDTVTYTFSGDNLAEGDSVFWTTDGDCLNPSGVATLSASKTASFSLSAGTYHLCYQFNDEYYTPQKPYNYYGNSFTLNVVDVTSVSDTSPYTNQNLEVSVSGVNLVSTNAASASNDGIRFTTGDCGTALTIGADGSTGLEQGGSIVLDFTAVSDVEMCIQLAGQTEWHKTDIEWDIQDEANIPNHLRMIFPFICNAGCANQAFSVYGPNVRSGDQFAIVEAGGTLTDETTISANTNALCDTFFTNADTYIFPGVDEDPVTTNIVSLTLNSNGWATGTLLEYLAADGTALDDPADQTPTICILPVNFDVEGVTDAALMQTDFNGLNGFVFRPDAVATDPTEIDIINDVHVYNMVWAENSAYSSVDNADLAIYTSDTSDTYWYFGLSATTSVLIRDDADDQEPPVAADCAGAAATLVTATISTGAQKFSLNGGTGFTAGEAGQFCLDETTAGNGITIDALTEPVWADYGVFAPRLFAKMSTASFAISDGDETAEAFLAAGDVQLVATSGGTAADERSCVDAAIGLWTANVNNEDYDRSSGNMGDVGTVGFCAQEDNTYRTQLKPTPYTATVVTVNRYPSAGPAATGSADSIGTLTFADYPASTKFVIDDVCADTTDDGASAASFADTVTVDGDNSFIASGKICAFDSENSMWVEIGDYTVGTPSVSIGDVYAHVGQEISGGNIGGAGVQPGDEIIITDGSAACDATTAPTAIATPSISIDNGVDAEFGAFTINEVIQDGDVCVNFGNDDTAITTVDNVRVIQIGDIELADLTVYAKAATSVTLAITDDDNLLENGDELALQNADDDCEDLTAAITTMATGAFPDPTTPTVGGAYKWCLSVAGASDFYDTGFDLQVVSFGTSYPAKTLFEENYEIFISGSGFKTGDSVIAVADCADIASFDDTLPVSFTASATGSEAGVAVIDFPNDAAIGTYSLCYQSSVYDSDAADASAQWVDSLLTVQVVATTDTTAHDSFAEGSFVLYDSMDGTFSDNSADTASRNGDQFTVLNPGTACNSAEFDANIVAEVTSSGIGHASQEITLNLAANNEAYQLCSLNNGAADETAFVAAGTIQVSSLTSLDPDWVLSTTATQDDEITLGGVGLFNGNSVTFTMGAATTGAQILSENSVVDDAASAKITVASRASRLPVATMTSTTR